MGIARLFGLFLGVGIGLLLCSPMARAEQIGLPLLPEQDHADWAAIGRLNIAGFRSRRACTGTLIAPRWVLTAAHCVRGRDGKTEPHGNIHFVAGWLRGTFVWHGRAASVHLHPGPKSVPQTDVALVQLQDPAPAERLRPIPLGSPSTDADLAIAIIGYQSTRSAMLSATFDCPPTQGAGAVRILDCPVIPGLSGSPVLSRGDTGWFVHAVVSARIERRGHAQAVVITPTPWALDTINGAP